MLKTIVVMLVVKNHLPGATHWIQQCDGNVVIFLFVIDMVATSSPSDDIKHFITKDAIKHSLSPRTQHAAHLERKYFQQLTGYA
uniref:Uncharacterized protein n=1 Tax=Timema monikensis TaxID=170555 RepID=A0A7R9E9E1_9NEOP|nr:unnamed protein product [Timema monikensis]